MITELLLLLPLPLPLPLPPPPPPPLLLLHYYIMSYAQLFHQLCMLNAIHLLVMTTFLPLGENSRGSLLKFYRSCLQIKAAITEKVGIMTVC